MEYIHIANDAANYTNIIVTLILVIMFCILVRAGSGFFISAVFSTCTTVYLEVAVMRWSGVYVASSRVTMQQVLL